jgi:hypothetical protein
MATSDLPLGSNGELGSWVRMTKYHYYNYCARCETMCWRPLSPLSILGFPLYYLFAVNYSSLNKHLTLQSQHIPVCHSHLIISHGQRFWCCWL